MCQAWEGEKRWMMARDEYISRAPAKEPVLPSEEEVAARKAALKKILDYAATLPRTV